MTNNKRNVVPKSIVIIDTSDFNYFVCFMMQKFDVINLLVINTKLPLKDD